MADVYGKLKSIIINELGVKPEQVTPDTRFIKDLGADSLDLDELRMACEVEFNMKFPDELAEKLVTVQDAVDYIEANGGG